MPYNSGAHIFCYYCLFLSLPPVSHLMNNLQKVKQLCCYWVAFISRKHLKSSSRKHKIFGKSGFMHPQIRCNERLPREFMNFDLHRQVNQCFTLPPTSITKRPISPFFITTNSSPPIVIKLRIKWLPWDALTWNKIYSWTNNKRSTIQNRMYWDTVWWSQFLLKN